MNKQKLIDVLKNEITFWRSKEAYGSQTRDVHTQATAAVRVSELKIALDIAQKLDEPEKVVVPQFVADWFEGNKRNLELTIFNLVLECYEKHTSNHTDIERWMNKNSNNPIETLIRMKDGYEIEKEPLYRVIIPFKMTSYKYAFINENGHHRTTDSFELVSKLTESQIKAIDATFWKIAVPVEE